MDALKYVPEDTVRTLANVQSQMTSLYVLVHQIMSASAVNRKNATAKNIIQTRLASTVDVMAILSVPAL